MTERTLTPAEAEAVLDRLLAGEEVYEDDLDAAAAALPDWEVPADYTGPESYKPLPKAGRRTLVARLRGWRRR